MALKSKSKITIGIIVWAALVLAAGAGPAPAETVEQTRAIAVVHPTAGSDVSGTVTFTRTGDGVKITADISGLSPGKHGFHIHEWGDCSAPDATSAGGHYNPFDQPHGGPEDEQRHLGDFGNVEAGPDGNAHYERIDRLISLDGPNSIIGRAVLVHADEDDLVSQPTGDAGDRLACGVIGFAE